MNFKIEKNIPITCKRGKWWELAQAMNHGDSVLLDTRNQAINFSSIVKRQGFIAISRTDNKTKKVRVWKIRKDKEKHETST